MHLYKNDDGTIYKATAGEPITRESIQTEYDNAKTELSKWQTALNEYDRLSGAVTADTAEDKSALQGEDDGDGHVTFKKNVPVI